MVPPLARTNPTAATVPRPWEMRRTTSGESVRVASFVTNDQTPYPTVDTSASSSAVRIVRL